VQLGSPKFERFLGTFFAIGLVVFMLWILVTIRRVTPLPASQLVNASSPIVLQQTNTNGGLYQALIVGGDAAHGTLRTGTRLRIRGESRTISLSPALVADLEAIYAAWCRGERPTTSRPKWGYYEIVVFCGEGPQLLQLYFSLQDLPPVFKQLERIVPQ
jgi:hypothetical protein